MKHPGLPTAVSIEVPVDPAFVSIVRATAAAVASRVGYSIEEIDDLRIAVDEASALLLAVGDDAAGPLRCKFVVEDDLIACSLRVQSRGESIPQGGFPWLVLKAVASDVMLKGSGNEREITLTGRRGNDHVAV